MFLKRSSSFCAFFICGYAFFKLMYITQLALFQQLLGSMPGVDPNDPAIQEALRKANEDARKKDDDKDENKE